MPKYSKRSERQLSTCCNDLQRLFNEIINTVDCTIIEGHRPMHRQNWLFKQEPPLTRVKFPDSKHNLMPSEAVDVVPYVNGVASYHLWHCAYFAGYVIATAERLGIPIRWGGNWDLDAEIMTDQEFQDLAHYEMT